MCAARAPSHGARRTPHLTHALVACACIAVCGGGGACGERCADGTSERRARGAYGPGRWAGTLPVTRSRSQPFAVVVADRHRLVARDPKSLIIRMSHAQKLFYFDIHGPYTLVHSARRVPGAGSPRSYHPQQCPMVVLAARTRRDV